MTKTEARRLIKELERIALDCFGCPSDATLRQVRDAVRALRAGGPDDGYFREKLGRVEEWSGIGLSSRKHERYPGGVDQMRVNVLGDCSVLRNLIDRSALLE